MISGWPRPALIFGNRARRIRSGGPPAGEGTTTLIGLLGKSRAGAAPWAWAVPQASAAAARTARRRFCLRIGKPPLEKNGSGQAHRRALRDRRQDGLEQRHVVHGIAGGRGER